MRELVESNTDYKPKDGMTKTEQKARMILFTKEFKALMDIRAGLPDTLKD